MVGTCFPSHGLADLLASEHGSCASSRKISFPDILRDGARALLQRRRIVR